MPATVVPLLPPDVAADLLRTMVSKPRNVRPEPSETNPFIRELTLHARPRRKRSPDKATPPRELRDQRTDERVVLESTVVEWVDKEQFTKMFASAARYALDLSPAGSKVLLLLQTLLRPGQEEVWLGYEPDGWALPDGTRTAPIARATFFRGVKDLCTARFIQPRARRQSVFWVNITRLFSGDRVRLVHEYRLGKRGTGEFIPTIHYGDGQKDKALDEAA